MKQDRDMPIVQENSNKKKQKKLLILMLFVIVLILMNSARYYFRLDFSSSKLFSLSAVTRETLQSVPEQMQITYYLSDKMKTLYPQVRDISDLLSSYASASEGKLTVAVIDPEKEKLETILQSLGIQSQQIQSIDKNETSFSNVYSAIAIEYMGTSAVIPFIISPAGLEYELTGRIDSIISNRHRKVAILIGNSAALNAEYIYAIPWLEAAGFECTEITSAAELSDIFTPLLVIGSDRLSYTDAAAIEEFVLKGGRAAFAVSSQTIDIYGNWTASASANDSLHYLLENWGFRIGKELLLDVSNFRMTMQSGSGAEPSSRYQYINYPFWIVALGADVSQSSPITSGFAGLELYWPNPLYLDDIENIFIESLVMTTPAAWLMPEPFITDPFAHYSSAENPSSIGQYAVAATAEGTFPGVFSGERKGENTRIFVVSDQYFPSTMIEYTNSPNNIDFLVNAILWLSDEDELLQIKNKATADIRLNKITDAEERESLEVRAYTVNFVAIPVLICFTGCFVWIGRKNERKKNAE